MMATLGTTLVQTTKGSASATSSYVLTLSQSAAAGNALFVFSYSGDENTSENVSGVTDDGGNTYSKLGSALLPPTLPTHTPGLELWWAKNIAAATQITVAYNGATKNKLVIAREYTHADLVAPIESQGSVSATASGAMSVTSQAITSPDAVFIGMGICVDSGGATPSWSNSGTYGNFTTSALVTDGIYTSILAVCDTTIYGNVSTTSTLGLTVSGTTVHAALGVQPIVLEGGRKVVGDGMVGLGDGGSTGNIFG